MSFNHHKILLLYM